MEDDGRCSQQLSGTTVKTSGAQRGNGTAPAFQSIYRRGLRTDIRHSAKVTLTCVADLNFALTLFVFVFSISLVQVILRHPKLNAAFEIWQ